MRHNAPSHSSPIRLGAIKANTEAVEGFWRKPGIGRSSRRFKNGSQISHETDSASNSTISHQSSKQEESMSRSSNSVQKKSFRLPSLDESRELIERTPSAPNYLEGYHWKKRDISIDNTPRLRESKEHSPVHRSEQKGSSTHHPLGLYSFGNTCYMNAALQCILCTPKFLDELCGTYNRFLKGGDSQRKFVATSSLINLSRFSGESSSQSLIDLLKKIKDSAAGYNTQFIGNDQNDAHEFLRTFLTVVHDELNVGVGRNKTYEEIEEIEGETESEAFLRWKSHISAVDDSVVYKFFGGIARSKTRCARCGYTSFAFDPFLDLVVPCNGNTLSVEKAVYEAYQSDVEEELWGKNKISCLRCKKKQSCFRSVSIIAWPRILVLQLSRFNEDGTKNSFSAFFIPTLSMNKVEYTLYAICCHDGTENGGHYTSYVSINHRTSPEMHFSVSPQPLGPTWYLCNDAAISLVSPTEVLEKDTSVYMLFYRRSQ